MDFYQKNTADSTNATASCWRRPTPTSDYQAMIISAKDTYDWVYGEIELNHYYLQSRSDVLNEATIMHEMMHVFGAKDITDDPLSIMQSSATNPRTVTVLTADANKLLKNKYTD
ncbi:MAG: hypothetical protein LBT21_04660 [Oscillospiraceae bacterium]|nr:hypothetical protein [Oscillospiraceae bacterium]